jgi:hypothetical protein
MSPTEVCPTCGRPIDAHNRHVRFRLPDPVNELPDRERTPGAWLSHDEPEPSVMMQVPNVGAFVRCLLPVHLTGGFTVTFGVWLAVHPDELQRAFRVWWDPAYADLVLDGWLANALPGWGLLATPATARVRDVDQTPYIAATDEALLHAVLSDEWAHEEVLARLP